jgi:hypothetical protein
MSRVLTLYEYCGSSDPKSNIGLSSLHPQGERRGEPEPELTFPELGPAQAAHNRKGSAVKHRQPILHSSTAEVTGTYELVTDGGVVLPDTARACVEGQRLIPNASWTLAGIDAKYVLIEDAPKPKRA